MKHILFIYIIIAISSCTNHYNSKNNSNNVLLLDFNKAPVEDSIFASTFIASVKPIILETTDDNLIGFLSAMQVTKDCICVLDDGPGGSSGLYIFSKSGKYLRKIGQKGQGPGEYISIYDFTINEENDEVFIIDKSALKFRIYKFSTGKFIRDIPFKDEMVEYASIQYNNGKLFANTVYFTKTEEGPMLHVLNTTGNIESKYLNIAVHNHGWLKSFFKGEGFFYCKNQKNPKFTHYFMDTIMTINNGRLEPYLAIKSNDWVKSSDIKNYKNYSQDAEKDIFFKIRELPIAFNVQNYVESDNYIYFSYSIKQEYINVIYDKRQDRILRSKALLDDILFNEKKYRIPLIGCGDENGMYGYINTTSIPSFNEYILKNRNSFIKTSLQFFFKKNITPDSNPIILYYEYKK